MAGNWDLMFHGFIFGQYITQGGPRGDDQFGSLNWGMLMASRTVAGGRFQARTMLSLDPATVTGRGYPLLLQTGETYDGLPLFDRQHPHDAIMELAVMYEREITGNVGVSLYAAPSGEPALGPVAFMHRVSAMDNPFAPLSHHWQDATHISYGVLTAGLFGNKWKLEGSYFNGREPNEERWGIDRIKLDSRSVRLTLNPADKWSLTLGYGFMESPEILEPDESVERITASVSHGTRIGESGQWATTFVYGGNRHEGESKYSGSLLLESQLILDSRNTFFARAENLNKSAGALVLDPNLHDSHDEFSVSALSLGYIREIGSVVGMTLGLGASGTVNSVATELQGVYGSRNPVGGSVFLRLRPRMKPVAMTGAGGAPGDAPHVHEGGDYATLGDEDTGRNIHSSQRTEGDVVGRSHCSHSSSESVVQCRFGQRKTGPNGVRAPL
jgi:hypothetical protein